MSLTKIIKKSTPPKKPYQDMPWIDTSEGKQVLKIWNRKTRTWEEVYSLIYEGLEPPLKTTSNYSTLLWRDTSGETPVLKMLNSDNTAWIAISSDSEATLADGFVVTSGTIKLNDNLPLTLGEGNDVTLSGNANGASLTSAGGIDIDAATGVTIDAGTSVEINGVTKTTISADSYMLWLKNTGYADDYAIYIDASEGHGGVTIRGEGVDIYGAATDPVNITAGAGQCYVSNELSALWAGASGAAGEVHLVAVDGGGAVAGKVVADAGGIDLMHGVNTQAEVTATGLKVNATDPASLFHVGAKPGTGVLGQVVIDVAASTIWVCTKAGTPGTWKSSALT